MITIYFEHHQIEIYKIVTQKVRNNCIQLDRGLYLPVMTRIWQQYNGRCLSPCPEVHISNSPRILSCSWPVPGPPRKRKPRRHEWGCQSKLSIGCHGYHSLWMAGSPQVGMSGGVQLHKESHDKSCDQLRLKVHKVKNWDKYRGFNQHLQLW